MPPRARRFVAAIGVLAFLTFWVWGLIALRGLLPPSAWIDFAIFGVGGTGGVIGGGIGGGIGGVTGGGKFILYIIAV